MQQIARTLSQFRRLISMARPPVWTFFVVPAGTVLGSALIVLPPYFVGKIVDALGRHEQSSAMRGLVLYVATSVFITVISLLGGQISRFQRDNIARNLRLALFERLHRARFDSLANLSLGEISNRLLGDVQTLSTSLEYSIIPAVGSLCALGATIAAMARENTMLALIAVACSIFAFLPQFALKSRFVALQRDRAFANDELYGIVGETTTLAALITLRTPAALRRVTRRLSKATSDIVSIDMTQGLVGSAIALASSLLSVIGPSLILAVGAYLAVHNRMSTGTVVTLLIYQSRMLAPFSALSQLQISITGLGVVTHRLLELADLPQENGGTEVFRPGTVSWEGVGARRAGRSILTNIDLTLEPGLHIALVGASGAGKSTFAATLLRLFEPDCGTIKVAGMDIGKMTLESLRTSVCIVAQEPHIFDASLLENMTLKAVNPTSDDIDRAARVSRLDSVIARLPEGLNTRVGPRGVRLSGGEQQRVCLARALLQNAGVLILDEALTGVDSEIERAILDDLRDAYKDALLIVITHRLSAVARFDRIIVMDNGAISAQGVHDDLRRSNPWYGVVSRAGALSAGVV